MLDDQQLLAQIERGSERLIEVFRAGKKILLFGNGGSAADAQHIAAEFVGRFAYNRPALPALSLSVNPSCVTAIGNDYGFDVLFSRQIEALGQAGDACIGISTSGNSANVVRGLEAARALGIFTIALVGKNPGTVGGAAELAIQIPSTVTPRIQEGHILVGHIISELVESAIFPSEVYLAPAK